MARKTVLGNKEVKSFINFGKERFGNKNVRLDDIFALCDDLKLDRGQYYRKLDSLRVKRGVYNFDRTVPVVSTPTVAVSAVTENVVPTPVVVEKTITEIVTKRVGSVSASEETVSFVPEVDPIFVNFGVFADLKKLICTKLFCPVYVTGETGIGKTLSVLQACAKLKREVIRVNITNETDEDDLFGGFRLIDGNMVFHKGPVVEAMERGAILLLDELSVAHPSRIMALQAVLEGKGAFLKKMGLKIEHKEGFNIIATDNTKGRGSESGRYIGVNVLNEAFLDRFVVTLEHTYPTKSQEVRIMSRYAETTAVRDENFVENLCNWAMIIRKTFSTGACDEVISTRRLVNIYKLFTIFGDKVKALTMSINRFDDYTKENFLNLYSKIDENMINMDEYETTQSEI